VIMSISYPIVVYRSVSETLAPLLSLRNILVPMIKDFVHIKVVGHMCMPSQQFANP
jgi:hypothetical protein